VNSFVRNDPDDRSRGAPEPDLGADWIGVREEFPGGRIVDERDWRPLRRVAVTEQPSLDQPQAHRAEVAGRDASNRDFWPPLSLRFAADDEE
jgi:hypothetical protein